MLPELESGGVERGTLEIGAYLCAAGHRSIVISGGGRLCTQLEREGSRHVSWDVGKKSLCTLRYLLPLRRLLVSEKADILHLRSRVPGWLGYLAWKTLPQEKRPRLVTTFHGFYSINAYSAVMAKGEKVIAISKTVADHIKAHYRVPEERIVLIHRGFDEKVFDPASVATERVEVLRKRWGLTDAEAPLIMLPGRVTRLKGHDIFIRSLCALKSHPWTAICVGDMDEASQHTAHLRTLLTELDLTPRVRFVGHCDDMPAAYLLSDLVVSATSSVPEAFGRVAVEAQAMSRPVIASAHGGSLETVKPGHAGWLVPPGDAAGLTNALVEAIPAQSLRERYGANGQLWVRENFTMKQMCEKTLELYKKLKAK